MSELKISRAARKKWKLDAEFDYISDQYSLHLKDQELKVFVKPDDRLNRLAEDFEHLGEARSRVSIAIVMLDSHYQNARSITREKLSQLLKSSIACLNDNNLLAVALCVRAVFEHYATHRYFETFVDKQLSSVVGTGDLVEGAKKLDKIRMKLQRVLNGTRIFHESPNSTEALHISDLIRGLNENEKKRYDVLCEYVHPNFLNNILSRIQDSRRPKPQEVDHVRIITTILCATLETFRNEILESDQRPAIELKSRLARAQNIDCRPTRVLGDYSTAHTGTGENRETALSFKHLYSGWDYYLVSHQFLETRKFEWESKRIGMSDNGAELFDVFRSGSQEIWFRIPKELLKEELGASDNS